MERKNIFQRIEENYNINTELRKIDRLFHNEEFFVNILSWNSMNSYNETYTLFSILENYLFKQWKHRGTCVTIEEFLKKSGSEFRFLGAKIDEETAINYIESMLNFIKLYRDNAHFVENKYHIISSSDFDNVFCHLVKTAKKHLGLAERIIDNVIIVYPEKAPLEQVLNLTIDENAQWELIRYCREKMDLSEKRKLLAYFATVFYIEEDENDDQNTKSIVRKATNILNNLHIRHNNKTGKYEKDYINDIADTEALALCDLLYNQILTIILLREQRKYDSVYKAFKDKQREKGKL